MPVPSQPEISVIVPLHNEEECVAGLFREIHVVMDTVGRPYEILAVDDGSEDQTAAFLSQLPSVTVLRHPYNKGNGAAVKTGIRRARGRLLVLLDGDGQHDPRDIPRLLAHADTYELVIGSRMGKGTQSGPRYLANWFYNRLATYVSGQQVLDLTSGFRVAHREYMVWLLPLLPNGFSYPSTSTLAFIRSGLSVTFVPITVQKRQGTSKLSPWRDGPRFVLTILKTTALFSPLKVFTPASVASVAIGIGHALYKILVLEARYTNLSILFITTGVLIFFIGLVSEQIAMLRFERFSQERDLDER